MESWKWKIVSIFQTMSLRANVSERGNPINIIMHFTICPIVSMRLLHILRMFVMTWSCVGQALYLIEIWKLKMENYFVFFHFPSIGGGRKIGLSLEKTKTWFYGRGFYLMEKWKLKMENCFVFLFSLAHSVFEWERSCCLRTIVSITTTVRE